jgi:hypothetical protein
MPLSASDKLEIHELTTRIYREVDADKKSAAGFASYFAQDGVFVAPYGEFTGPAKVQAFMESHIAAGKEDGVRHYLTNISVDEHEVGARVQFYVLKLNIAVGPVGIASAAGDCLVKRTPQGWRFHRFNLTIDPAMFDARKPALTSTPKS